MRKTIAVTFPTDASAPIPAWRPGRRAPNSSQQPRNFWRKTTATGPPASAWHSPAACAECAGESDKRRRSGGIDGTNFVQTRRKAPGAAQTGAKAETLQSPGQVEGQEVCCQICGAAQDRGAQIETAQDSSREFVAAEESGNSPRDRRAAAAHAGILYL